MEAQNSLLCDDTEKHRFFHRPKKKNRFEPGQLVKVKGFARIYSSLDTDDKRDGIIFTAQMARYCNKTCRILKVGTSLFSERTHRTMKTVTPFYLLEGLTCEGNVIGFQHRCDHGCFLLWHQDWLEAA